MGERISKGEEQVLAWFYEHDIVASPRTIAFELDLPHNSIKQHCMALVEYGFLEHPQPPDGLTNTGIYAISNNGRRYIAGEMTISELRDLVDE